MVTIGGSAAPRAMIKWFRDRGIEVGHAWGMTETSPIGTCGAPPAGWDEMSDEEQVDYIAKQGRVAVRRRAAHRRRRRQCPAARRRDARAGCRCRGPWVIKRYFKDERGRDRRRRHGSTPATSPRIHPDGTLQITDRSKDVIKSGGEWISSIELENAAVGCPGVAEAAAIGIAHPKWDERPLLVCVRVDGQRRLRGQDPRASRPPMSPNGGCPTRSSSSTSCRTPRPASSSKRTLREQFRDYRFADAEAMVGPRLDG